jgi:hypothetical protein
MTMPEAHTLTVITSRTSVSRTMPGAHTLTHFAWQVTRLRLQRGGSPEAAVAAAVGKAAEEAQKRLIVEAEGLRAQLNSTAAGSRCLTPRLQIDG